MILKKSFLNFGIYKRIKNTISNNVWITGTVYGLIFSKSSMITGGPTTVVVTTFHMWSTIEIAKYIIMKLHETIPRYLRTATESGIAKTTATKSSTAG